MSAIKQDKKTKRRRRGRIGIWTVASIAILGSLLFVLGLSLSGRSLTAPSWVAARIVNQVNAKMAAGHVTLGRLQVQVDGAGIPRVFLADLGIFDARGAEVVRLNNVGARFSVAALFKQEIKPESISLSGAQMTLRRQADGQLDVSFGSGSTTSGTLPDVLDLLDDALATEPLDEVAFLAAEDLTVTLEDARSGRLWQITGGGMQVRRGANGLDISVDFEVFNGTEDLAETIIGISTSADSSQASIGATFKNAAAADIALQSPALSFLGILNAPISGSLRADFDDFGELSKLAGTMEIGTGALQPAPNTLPVRFASAKSYFEFEPIPQKIVFSEVSVVSETFNIVSQGQAYLNDFQQGWPTTLIGQFTLSDLVVHPTDVFEKQIAFSQGAADFRLKLNPFSVEVGQLVLSEGTEKMVASGDISAAEEGWKVAADLQVNQISRDRLLSLWPLGFSPNTRNWLDGHLSSALLDNVNVAVRLRPGEPIRRSLGWEFQDTTVRYINSQPNIENASGYALIDGDVFTLVIEDGQVEPPQGGPINVGGSTIQIPDITAKPAPIHISLHGAANTTAVLSLLDEPPFRILRNASFKPDVSTGRALFDAEIDFTLKRLIGVEDVKYSVNGTLLDVRSEKLVPGRVLTGQGLRLTADNKQVEIAGPVHLGQVAADVVWRRTADDPTTSAVSGTVELSQEFIKEFGIGLPDDAVSGAGIGQFTVSFATDVPPRFSLHSDLNRVGLRVSQIGWSKSKNTTGTLDVAGQLGDKPGIERLEISAGGLSAQGGQVVLAENGTMQATTFSRVVVGGWLDAPVTLRGRGSGVVPSVHLSSGSIDIRKTAFGGAETSSSGAGGPISLALDKVIVSEGMTLTDFAGEFDSSGGLRGNFTARMNGKTRLSGSLVPDANGTAVVVKSANAGALLRNSGVVEYANRGSLDLTLRPRAENGVYDGQMQIRRTNVRNAPGMTDLLSAISVVGLLEQLTGSGILFENVQANFVLSPTNVRLIRSSAVGPSLGVSLDGIYDLTTSTMDMQGVVSPVYFLNGIGQVFSRRGEGLFGFNFRLRGTSENPKVNVNPLSILTPGLFRDIFRAPPPEPSQ